ncbi:MAG: YggS family pyridoxal phosphate-dependent enzyme [Actinobacteria bacterium]|nr:YggS family pyridoxal phosphate-dependent enzyme [Actinomycetota bacterium]
MSEPRTDPNLQDPRTAEIAANLADARRAIDEAARQCGREPNDVTLVAVTKTWPAEDVDRLASLGVMDFGENRAQELSEKVEHGESLPHIGEAVQWHFVGQLQRNKVKLVAPVASMVHSVDRASLIGALDRGVAAAERDPLPCLIQVNLDEEPVEGRAGVRPADALALADQVAAAENLELAGVMGVAPHPQATEATEATAEAFQRLVVVSRQIADIYPSATNISAGMSGDFVAAIEAGATHVRLGAVLLGERRIGEVTSEPGGGFPPRPVQCKSRE